MRGKFITLEGGEGAGKSTQCARLKARLESAGINVNVTREPGGSPGAEDIRQLIVHGDPDRWDAQTEALLIYAARRDHVKRLIEPALAAGSWVICDRFSDSTMAYQGHAGGVGRQWVEQLDDLAIGGLKPDLTLMLDLSVSEGLARAKTRGGADRFERQDTSFHEALRSAFLEIAGQEPDRCAVIDASGAPDTVETAIWAEVSSRLAIGKR